MEARGGVPATWLPGGALVVGGCLALTWLSGRFQWGVGHAERPVLWVVGVLLLMGLGFVLSAGWASARGARAPLWLLLGVALVARAVLLPSNLILESDAYRYVLDGMSVLHGVNPFRYAPERVRFDGREEWGDSLEGPEARLIIARINHAELPTIYPPLSQAAFAAGAALSPWDWRGQRWVFLSFDVATILLLAWGLRRLGKPVAWVAVYAWNPLILKEICNSVHLESLAALLVVGFVLLLALRANEPAPGVAAAAGALLALGFLAKLYPLMLAPIGLAVLARGRQPGRNMLVYGGAAGVLAVLGFLPFLGVGWERLSESLVAYSQHWRSNTGAFGLLVGMLPGAGYLTLAVPAGTALALSWRVWQAQAEHMGDAVVFAVQGTLLAWFLFLPAAFPWYATALLAVSAMRPRPWVFALSIAFSLYYLLFYYDYRQLSQSWSTLTQLVEHGAVWLALATGWIAGLTLRRREEARACVSA